MIDLKMWLWRSFKLFRRLGHVMRAGDLTWHDPGPKFWDNVWKRWMNSYTKRGGAARRRFCVICKKPEGGGAEINPPGCARVKDGGKTHTNITNGTSTAFCLIPLHYPVSQMFTAAWIRGFILSSFSSETSSWRQPHQQQLLHLQIPCCCW